MNAREMVTVAEVDQVTMEKLTADFRTLAADMEQLLKATGDQTGQQIAQVRAKAEESLKAARTRIDEFQGVALTKVRAARHATDDYVRANPWRLMAICAVAGFGLGLVVARNVVVAPNGISDS